MNPVTSENSAVQPGTPKELPVDHLRFHKAHAHLAATFGNDAFALKAEAFARFFGTPTFLSAQTLIVILWIGANIAGLTHFDIYPFILLNLAFSLQAAYAAPLILLAQTRQAARDKANADADAQHREALAVANEQRLASAAQNSALLLELLEQNTRMTELTKTLTERIETLTLDMHQHFVKKPAAQ
ncbi:DUF1003 domain-containing protein [Pseudomonas sp. 10B1]|uniref:DUF1003 domain-containing protein n=1 Tax=unclassified Pseudomonas TaxID=196821 RepID=UPI002AB546F0|nr:MULTISPECIES: DUF1003 domain-containing protein [unclassified Pseudomonas]MDY7561378.1 DUF1003 domain-containing protein [Pseudomonas sp. AB6]MEA9978480.1 DUF1003 domain-containing protein [Pseudomonas sp. RTS4]MEA9996750.1 DUF1003 domain-containing protein [Pseudomonas sp. AA4]MEB0088897.1 DUF1003 domain-containing protein [Pseudomonas sp. RTI1]MEB0128280.1 DUF1003 domain-containing protein [Pseudomonas sp. CCC1.2]